MFQVGLARGFFRLFEVRIKRAPSVTENSYIGIAGNSVFILLNEYRLLSGLKVAALPQLFERGFRVLEVIEPTNKDSTIESVYFNHGIQALSDYFFR